jgi:hypothetical protein
MKTIYVVFGYMNTGSCSLTYPEDFETVGFYEVKDECQEHVDRLNTENGVDQNGEWLDQDDVQHDDPYDGMMYVVDVLENLSKK